MDTQQLGVVLEERISKMALGILLLYAIFSAIAAPFSGFTEINNLSKYDRQAMEWISQNTPSDSQFTVLTGEQYWESDTISEWFPALSKRISTSTVQGSEWLPAQQYAKQIQSYNFLQTCAEEDMECILAWEKSADITDAYLYLRKPVVGDKSSQFPVFYSLLASDHAQLIFDNQGVSIFKVGN